MNKKISRKLFRITFGLILCVFFATLIFQIFFFEDFYLSRKTKQLVHEVDKFTTMYSYQIVSEKALASALSDYEENNSSRLAIFSQDGKLKYLANYNHNTEDTESLTAFWSQLLSNRELINKVIQNNKIQWTIFTDSKSGNKKIGVIAPMSLQRSNDSLVISVSPVQPITEASSVLRDFYIYLLIGFLFMALLMSQIYSKLISNPLIKINRVAERMSLLDFSAKCEIKSEDEIGNLARTLNFLSTNLETSLAKLKEKNLLLENEIERERNLEMMRKDFVASVSHDLKTPIGIISGYAEGILDGVASEETTSQYLQTIMEESEKMNLLVTSMLELSNLESDSISLNIETFNIVRMVTRMVNKLSLEMSNKNLQVAFRSMPEYGYVKGDILKIEQVLQNIITNGIKYSPVGNKINISIIGEAENFVISVENEGISIPSTELENIFAKFYKLDKSGDRTKGSYGLGLAIVKRILDLHHSTYSMTSTKNSVNFTFTLQKEELEDVE